RPCMVIEDDGIVYAWSDLVEGAPPRIVVARPTLSASAVAPIGGAEGLSPFNLLDEHVTFDDLLLGAGWHRHMGPHGQLIQACWTRPDDPDNPCSAHTLTEQPNVLVAF